LVLILFSAKTQANAPNIPLGNILFIVNAACYSIYLIMVKPLVIRYSSITLMKLFFLFAVIMNLPVGISEFMEVEWAVLSLDTIWKLVFVVVGTTVLTYLFNIYALKHLSPSTIGAFIYLQPLLAALFAILAGADMLTPLRTLAAILIFLGVFLSTRRPRQA
jgi:drug/metabolite transporter (DMT)-like permease